MKKVLYAALIFEISRTGHSGYLYSSLHVLSIIPVFDILSSPAIGVVYYCYSYTSFIISCNRLSHPIFLCIFPSSLGKISTCEQCPSSVGAHERPIRAGPAAHEEGGALVSPQLRPLGLQPAKRAEQGGPGPAASTGTSQEGPPICSTTRYTNGSFNQSHLKATHCLIHMRGINQDIKKACPN